MPRYIDAEKIKYTEYINGDVTVSKDLVEKIPTADAQEVKHGKWLNYRFGLEVVTCSICRAVYEGGDSFRFCPKCGAKMDLEED